ncbi:MAG: beta-hydroxyacyl-ACP dehydratase [Bacteroidales bacterium]|nr:beta-hydroxyacyl-ACP dehydratase [Bacteroidales bacterium]
MLEHELYTVLETTDNTVCVRLKPESVIFQAHFPDNPIMPGVCIVGMVEELVERMKGCRLTLSEARNVKYLAVLKPDANQDVIVCFDKVEEDGIRLRTNGVVMADEKVYTKFSLIFARV